MSTASTLLSLPLALLAVRAPLLATASHSLTRPLSRRARRATQTTTVSRTSLPRSTRRSARARLSFSGQSLRDPLAATSARRPRAASTVTRTLRDAARGVRPGHFLGRPDGGLHRLAAAHPDRDRVRGAKRQLAAGVANLGAGEHLPRPHRPPGRVPRDPVLEQFEALLISRALTRSAEHHRDQLDSAALRGADQDVARPSGSPSHPVTQGSRSSSGCGWRSEAATQAFSVGSAIGKPGEVRFEQPVGEHRESRALE